MDLHKPKVWHSVTCTSTTSQQLVSCADIHVIVSTSLTVFLSSVFQNMQKCKWTDNIQLGASSWGCRLEVSHISRRIAQTMELISFVGVQYFHRESHSVLLHSCVLSFPIFIFSIFHGGFRQMVWSCLLTGPVCHTQEYSRWDRGGVAMIGLTWG